MSNFYHGGNHGQNHHVLVEQMSVVLVTFPRNKSPLMYIQEMQVHSHRNDPRPTEDCSSSTSFFPQQNHEQHRTAGDDCGRNALPSAFRAT